MKFSIQLISGGHRSVQSDDASLESFCKRIQNAGGITLHEHLYVVGLRESKEYKMWIPYHAMAWIREEP